MLILFLRSFLSSLPLLKLSLGGKIENQKGIENLWEVGLFKRDIFLLVRLHIWVKISLYLYNVAHEKLAHRKQLRTVNVCFNLSLIHI